MNADARCPEFLSIYVDEQMKHGFKGASEAEVDDRLNKVVILFRFLHDKDVFEEYYKLHLQKRLLAGKSASDDAEKAMIAKLKTGMCAPATAGGCLFVCVRGGFAGRVAAVEDSAWKELVSAVA
jgi:hypothetical protein